MTSVESVQEQVAAIVRRHLEDKFAGKLVFDPIRIVPRIDQFGDEYLHIYVIYEGDGNLLEPRWLNGLYIRMRPEFVKLGVMSIPSMSYRDRIEDGRLTEMVWATPFDDVSQ